MLRINGAGIVQWTANGKAVIAASDYIEYTATADATNSSMLFTWLDDDGIIRAQKLNNATGAVSWTNCGTVICSRNESHQEPVITHNGGSGAIIS